ncbi:hypothetical protein [Anthocerotibacter panamensis]|uniref:hypothetical protein n=1 Tax=Anthocerotibacter panamensis TaxID=2857077 RepID=UPI001C406B6A|nr:hypothetical protein [Anthocerotibacter panamensis]
MATTLLTAALLCLPAILIDPYRIFGLTNFNKKNFEPNTRYLKIEYLLKHDDYNAYIFGSSRAAYYDVHLVNRMTKNFYYNMTASGQNALGVLQELEWVLANKHPRQVILMLDYDISHRRFSETDLLRREHPLVSGESKLKFYASYMLFEPKLLLHCLKANLFKRDTYYTFDPNTAQSAIETRPALAPATKVNLESTLKRLQFPEKLDLPLPKASLEEYQRMADLTKKSKTERIVIIHPYYYRLFSVFDIDDYTNWLRNTVNIFGVVWDFSGVNSVTSNGNNYEDILHFSKAIGMLVLSKVFGSTEFVAHVPDDFGVKVTKENVEAHIQQIRKEYNRYQQMHHYLKTEHPSS